MARSRLPYAPRAERGAAALIVTTALLLVSTLIALYVNRNLIVEQRSATNQYRSTQAFEAAEAGIEWALALLNEREAIDGSCTASSDGGTSFRTRYLGAPDASARFTPVTWTQEGTAMPLQPSCVHAAGGWTCSCPASGASTLAAPDGTTPAPAFSVRFTPSTRPGVVHLVSTGCTSLAGACLAGSTTDPDATATVDVEIGALPALRAAPAATLTTRGAFDADAASIGLGNPDPRTGIALHTGGRIAAGNARFSGPAGSAGTVIAGDDASLAAMSTDRFFATYFGLSKPAWKQLPLLARLLCEQGCNAAQLADVAASPDGALVRVEGDLLLAGPAVIGSPEHPVAIVVDGNLRFEGSVTLHGLVYAATVQWNDADAGASLRGAVVSEGNYRGNGAPELVYDAGLLATLKTRPGAFARVSGSWRDF